MFLHSSPNSQNRTVEYANACASHDHCDANVVMLEAFEERFGREPNLDADTDLFNAAWEIARRRWIGFYDPTASRYRLRARRERLGLSQTQVAEAAALRWPAAVSEAERNPRSAYVKHVRCALARIEHARRVQRREAARTASLEPLWAAIPESTAKQAFRAAIIDHAITLLTDGQSSEYDAVVVFLSSAELKEPLDRWLEAQGGA